jgi:ATP-binding cassette subfamily B protein
MSRPQATVRQAIRRFWPYIAEDRWFFGLSLLLLIISTACETVAIWMFGAITDDAIKSASLSGFWLPAAVWVGMAVIAGATSYVLTWLMSWVAERMLLRLRNAVYAHLQDLSPDFFARNNNGDLVARLTSDVDAIEELVGSGIIQFMGIILTVLCYGTAAVVLSWKLAIAAFVLAPLFWLASRIFAKRIKVVSREERDFNGVMSATIQENIANLPLVQAYNQQAAERDQLDYQGRSWMRTKIKEAKLAAAYTPLVDVVEVACLLLVMGAGIWQISQGAMTLGGVIAFTAYLGYLYPPLRDLGQLSISFNSAAAASDRITELLETTPTVVQSPNARVLANPATVVAMEGVGYHYPGTRRPAVQGLTFQAKRGQLVLLTGASGAGKSTIAKLLLRFADPARGKITLDGFDIRDLTIESLREQISLVPQQHYIFNCSVRDNIAYGRPDSTDAEIVAAAQAADAHEFIMDLPDGYETMLDSTGQRLSGGQRQRLALARAIVRDSPILILDEPTTGLDSESTQRVLAPLRRLAQHKTIIIISHDLAHIGHIADHVVVLAQGRLVEQGTHTDLRYASGPYARLYDQQQGVNRQFPQPNRHRIAGTL